MGSFREEMRLAREDLHEAMSFTALYINGDEPTMAIPVSIRLHEKWLALGDLKGTNFNYAEMSAVDPRIVFLLAEIRPVRNAIVSVSPGLAFVVDTVDPDDPPTVTANCVLMDKADTEGLPVP